MKPIDNLARLFRSQKHNWLSDSSEVLDEIPVALIAADADQTISFANRRALKTFGYQANDLLGKKVHELLPGSGHQPTTPQNPGTITVKSDEEGLRQDGARFPVRVHLRKIGTADLPITFLAIEDLTKERELERMKQEFFAMVSHDMRTPLSAVAGNVTLLTEGVFGTLPEQVAETLNKTDLMLKRLIKLINDLLLIEKLSSGTFEVDIKPTTANKFIEEALATVAHSADEHNVTFVFNTAHAKDVQVIADCDRIVQVLVNLMSNAIKFSRPGGTVYVKCAVELEFMRISVVDQGKGITLSQQMTIFEKFKQADSVADTKAGGIGLGLAISKSIIEQHGGSIGVISNEGAGSEFWFTLPLNNA
jgi:PAS domain S-box-containing protein